MDKEMRRLDACIDACAGISTEALESGAIKELVEAAAGVMGTPSGFQDDDEQLAKGRLSRALAKMEAPDA